MNKSIKFFIISLITILLLVSINQVMDYYIGFQSKEFVEELGEFAGSNQLQISALKEIEIQNIKLSFDKHLQLKYHILLNSIKRINSANGYEVNITSKDSKDKFKCKALCFGDHIFSIEIEFNNYNSNYLKILKNRFENKFYKIKVVWTANPSL